MKQIDANLPISEVTVFEDRAYVVRRGLVQFETGTARLVVPGIAATVLERTLHVSTMGPVRVVSTSMQRDSTPPAVSSAHLGRETRAQKEHDEVASFLYDKIATDVGNGSFDEEAALAAWQLLEDHDVTQSTPPGPEARSSLSPEHCVTYEVVFESSESGPHPVQVAYVVANATWRPRHRADLRTGNGAPVVTFETEAVVWQNTGEAWNDVVLTCCTERPGAPTRPPELRSDWIDVRGKSSPQPDQDASDSHPVSPEDAALMPNDRGRALRLTAPQRAHVPSDGGPHPVRLGEFREAADLRVSWNAQVGGHATVLTVVRNTGEEPLLAGPVELVRDQGPLGRSLIGYVACGEDFVVDWGPDEAIRVNREVEELPSETRMMSSWVRTPYRVRICLSNLSRQDRALRVEEHLPSGDDKRVTYNVDTSSGFAKPDAQGRLLWAIELGPDSQQTIEVHYLVEQRATSLRA